MPHAECLALAVAALLVAPSVLFADTPPLASAPVDLHTVAPAGGGLPSLDVSVDLVRGLVVANGVETAIPIDRASLPPERAVTVANIAIGEGRHVVRVRVPLKDSEGNAGPAWEAILAGGRKEPIFTGSTGPTLGDPGERTGKAIRVVPNGATSFVLVGDTREDLTICGQPLTLLDPLALYPGTLQLRPATVQRLDADEQASAEPVVAAEKAGAIDAALAQLLAARGSSVPGSRGAELTDGDPSTVWRERRPGIGQGEFVVMSAPKAVPIARMELTVSPPDAGPAGNGAGPKTFYLVTTSGAFEVTLPTDGWLKAGAAYQVVFPRPIETSCIALVLESAYSRGLAHPDVGIAELRAYSEFDVPSASLDDVAKLLSGSRSLAAAELLQRAGPRALTAVASAYDGLDARGRALAIDVATSHDPCEEAAPLLARGLCEAQGQAPRKAREKLERCRGGAPALAERLRADAASAACIAPVLAALAPDAALEPVADAIASTGEDDHDTRLVLRDAFARALTLAPRGRLASILGDVRRSRVARLEIMRAAAGHLVEAQEASERALAELMSDAPSMRVRYLALGAFGELSRAGDRAASAHLVESLARDPEWPVRARAAGLGAGLPEAVGPLVAATRDPEARVREAALGALARTPSPDATRAGIDALVRDSRLQVDEWWFVKAEALALLAKAPPSKEVDGSIAAALRDPSPRVRVAAAVALGAHRAWDYRGPLGERLDDAGEEPAVRAAAARSLGAACDEDSDTIERLTAYARMLASPSTEEDAKQIGFGALSGLSAIHPRDLRTRIAPLLTTSAPAYVQSAAQQALAAPSSCEAKGIVH